MISPLTPLHVKSTNRYSATLSKTRRKGVVFHYMLCVYFLAFLHLYMWVVSSLRDAL